MCKVSIIVPIYNAEKYLDRCLQSLINQTFIDIEIIAINDGSTDKSLDILNKFNKIDERIVIINNKNVGVSKSRNIGVEKARGESIVFVDSDDWIDRDMIEIMYTQMIEKSVDLVMCTYIRKFESHSKEKVFDLPPVSYYSKVKVKNELLRKLIGPIGSELSNPEYLDALGTVWAKMYRTSLIKDNNIKFVDLNEIGSGEDTLFNVYVLNKVNSAIILNKPMYYYWRSNSESITSRYIEDFPLKRERFFNYFFDFIDKSNLENEFKIALNNRICISVLGMGLIECSENNNSSIIIKINNIKKLLKEEYIEKAYKDLELKHFKAHWKLFYFFNKNKMSLPAFLMLNIIELLRKTI